MSLFSMPIVPVGRKYGSIEKRFRRFHRLNAHVYTALVMLAREYRKATKRERVGMKMLWEKLRYEFGVRTTEKADYTLNNDFTPYYARLISRREPDLCDAFEFRALSAPARSTRRAA